MERPFSLFTNFIVNLAALLKNLWTYKRTMLYLYKNKGPKALYNFLFIKSFVLAGGEGTGNWVGALMSPLFFIFPQLKSYLSLYPFVVEIEVTNKCNKGCLFCEHTYWNEENIDLSFEDFKKIVDQFPRLKWVNLTGEGDAFLNKDYLEMIGYLKSKDISVVFADSFDLLNEDTARKLIRLGVDGIWVSLDAATKETYERIKAGCNFERTINNIKKLIEIKKEMNSPLPEVWFRYIISTVNLNEMPAYVELVHSLGDRRSLGDGSRIEFVGLLSFKEVEDYYLPEVPAQILQVVWSRARRLDMPVVFSHPLHSSKLLPMQFCAAWGEPYIMMGGYVLPCCAVLMSNQRQFLREHSFGNMLQEPFRDIWYSKRYREFRKAVCRDRGMVPILCKGCRAYNTLEREQGYGITDQI